MNVEVDDIRLQRRYREARLFCRFSARNRQRIGVAVGMAAQLQPSTDLRVMGQQHADGHPVDDHGRAGHVAVVPAVAFETAGLPQHEAAEACHVLVRITGLVPVQRGEQLVAMQGGAILPDSGCRGNRFISAPALKQPPPSSSLLFINKRFTRSSPGPVRGQGRLLV